MTVDFAIVIAHGWQFAWHRPVEVVYNVAQLLQILLEEQELVKIQMCG